MTAKKNTKNKNSEFKKTSTVTTGITTALVAGYLLFGPNGEKNRKAVKGWTLKVKGEVLEKLEKVKEISEPTYNHIIDSVAEKYFSPENKNEILTLVKDMKSHWKKILKNSKGNAKTDSQNTKHKNPVRK